MLPLRPMINIDLLKPRAMRPNPVFILDIIKIYKNNMSNQLKYRYFKVPANISFKIIKLVKSIKLLWMSLMFSSFVLELFIISL